MSSSHATTTTNATTKTTHVLTSSSYFECTVLPPMNSISGTLLPRILQKGRQRRIVSIEIHRVTSIQTKRSYDECIIRVLFPSKGTKSKNRNKHIRLHQNNGDPSSSVGNDNADDDDNDDDDTESIYTVSPQFLDNTSSDATNAGLGAVANTNTNSDSQKDDPMYPGWRAKYRFPIRCIVLKGTRRTSVVVEITLGKKKEVREIIFDTITDSEHFCKVIHSEIQKDLERTNDKMIVAMGTDVDTILHQTPEESMVQSFLVEIVSAWDIPVADFTSSDPFVTCIFEGNEVHRTKYISKTLEPIWTVATDSLFLLRDIHITNQLFRSDGLLCILYDFDKLGKNDSLGAITVPPKMIYDAKGERMEFPLERPPKKKGKLKLSGYLAIRIRRATQYDITFIDNLHAGIHNKGTLVIPGMKNGIEISDHSQFQGGKGNIKSLLTKRSRMPKGAKDKHEREYKIRPGPDPKRVDETTWMTKDNIDRECETKSINWVDVGAGRLGRLFVEVLRCDDLPNLDVGGFAGNKTDAFVAIVFEDAVVQTDVIDDTLSPRWLPWTKRAFIFHILHSSSQLFLGVFDYDPGINPTDDHDLIGRVSVDLSNLQKDTEYTLNYNLYPTARMSARQKQGSITIRVRLEIHDERKLLLSAIEPPPKIYVNVKTRKEFRVMRYTCTGKYDMEKYSTKVINAYVEELLALRNTMFFIEDGFMTVLLWRGTLPMHIPYIWNETFYFPIHSLSALLVAVLLVERPQLIPTIFFASIAWLLVATQSYRRSLPDLWSRCKSSKELSEILVLGESSTPPESIKQNQNKKEAEQFLLGWEKRLADAEEAAEKAVKEQIEAREEYERQMDEVGDTAEIDSDTKRDGLTIDPFKPLLFPVQQNLALVCRYVRHVRHVISWQECYIAYWITIGCILLSIVCLFIPWFFLIKWFTRILVWTVFGPWMKLVDIYYISQIKPLTPEEIELKKQKARQLRFLQTKVAVQEARLKREEQAKLKDMKRHLFGKYITRVPVLKEDRYRDLPTTLSHAKPYRKGATALSELAMQEAGYHKERIPGQHLVGHMIPKIETVGFTEAPIGQPTANMALVDKSRPGGFVGTMTDSTTAAYLKVGSLVLTAAVVTWFGVPVLAAFTELMISFLK